jgi:hypothetical protein
MKAQLNEAGRRIGQAHHNARLTDREVEQLIADRGDEKDPSMSYGQLAAKYGISRSSARDLCCGRRRGQVGEVHEVAPARRPKVEKVRVKLTIPLHYRARLHRLGGAKFIMKAIEAATK